MAVQLSRKAWTEYIRAQAQRTRAQKPNFAKYGKFIMNTGHPASRFRPHFFSSLRSATSFQSIVPRYRPPSGNTFTTGSGTRMHNFQNKASRSKVYWVAAHGSQQSMASQFTVPDGVYIVPISRPGYLVSTMFSEGSGYPQTLREMKKNPQIFQRWIRRDPLLYDELPTPMKPWYKTSRIYSPRDKMLNINLTFKDPSPRLNAEMKIDRVDALPKSRFFNFHGHPSTSIKEVVEFLGPGVYFVLACRLTPGRSMNLEGAVNLYHSFPNKEKRNLQQSYMNDRPNTIARFLNQQEALRNQRLKKRPTSSTPVRSASPKKARTNAYVPAKNRLSRRLLRFFGI